VLAVVVTLAVRSGAGPDERLGGGPIATASDTATGSAAHTGEPVATGPDGVVPWVPLPPTFPVIPTTTTPASPDPALAQGLPVCRATDLAATSAGDGAMGTMYLLITLAKVPGRPDCRLEGFPTVTSLVDAAAVSIPSEQASALESSGPLATYPHPVRVGAGQPASLAFRWSNWCAPAVRQTHVRLTWPGSAGSLTVAGFGSSPGCMEDPATTVMKPPFVVGNFAPRDVAPAQLHTAYDEVLVRLRPASRAPAAGVAGFVVILSTPIEVALDPCPDVVVTSSGASETPTRAALNCAAVPHRDGNGRPVLPAGVDVSFDVEVPAPSTTSAKVSWALVLPEGTRHVGESLLLGAR